MACRSRGAVVVWWVEAASWGEAMEHRYRRHGWEMPESAVWLSFPSPYSEAEEWESRRIFAAWQDVIDRDYHAASESESIPEVGGNSGTDSQNRTP
ncbi:hypothetical protein [Tuwongella immobilis]|nr:hypothetical protein [Tuwongella immobilis]